MTTLLLKAQARRILFGQPGSKAVMKNKLLLATKVAHKELGDKVAMYVGCRASDGR